ncbi:family 43 glycosylhydrolase, partial [Hymenobacter sp. AT01-02]|uniref:family 43 glycosylhydrolase n=1 Tax=Hymenobacter sp. AT01-02 TaxID=1571877 RepID=UPI00191C221C
MPKTPHFTYTSRTEFYTIYLLLAVAIKESMRVPKAKVFVLAILLATMRISLLAQVPPPWGDWNRWGEQADSTYSNPIIPSDYSDLDCIKVGDDYYAITSTFQFSPGLTILHSRDLVNWQFAGHAVADLTQIGPELNWDKMNRYGRGIWAGTIRHHNGRFYIYFGTPEEGYFMTSAPRPAGPWERLSPVLAESGWDDCSVLWDEKGQGGWWVRTSP